MKNLYLSFLMAMLMLCMSVVPAFAAFTMPELPVTDLETAGTAVLGLVAVAVVIGIVVRTFKKA